MSVDDPVLQQLSQRVLSIEQGRQVDRIAIETYGMQSLVLMENAAIGCTHWLRDRFELHASTRQLPRTVILCGRGNNGGDGLAIARHLRCYGWDVTVFLLGPAERLSADTRANADILLTGNKEGLTWWNDSESPAPLRAVLSKAGLVIDAMLGSGATGDPRPPFEQWITEANRCQAFRVAIDIPTGVNAGTGEQGSPTFAADATLTFVSLKPAMVGARAQALFGELSVLPIGIPAPLVDALLSSSQPLP